MAMEGSVTQTRKGLVVNLAAIAATAVIINPKLAAAFSGHAIESWIRGVIDAFGLGLLM